MSLEHLAAQHGLMPGAHTDPWGEMGNASNTSVFVSTLSEREDLIFGTLYLVFGIMSLSGNSLLLLVAYQKRSVLKPAEFFIVNLAVSDLSMTVTLFPLATSSFFAHRQQVLAVPRRSAAAVRLGVRPAVCHGAASRVGQLRPRALRDGLLHRLESLEQGGHALHPRPLHLLLPPPLPAHPRVLLADPLDGAGVPQSRQPARVPAAQSPQRAQPHREAPKNYHGQRTRLLAVLLLCDNHNTKLCMDVDTFPHP
ncbi:spermatogenesis-associated protein 2 isoform X2 [Colius striatus]|uniref:spermatogenesis-associated protein 2 isoform X2 n=1 Tax=Colius striatus TaxID=57412 RepID=UPI002B1E8643|nr:spermatogenesis-associated protein 2 isoform X2 [Colius striatus]